MLAKFERKVKVFYKTKGEKGAERSKRKTEKGGVL